jgi:hypothetical protein
VITEWLLLIGTFLVGGLSSYTTTVASRGPYGAEITAQQGAFRSIVNGLNVLAFFAALIWGFAHLTWYLVLLAAIGVLIFNGLIYGRREAFAFWYGIQPLLSILCIAGTVILWVAL